MVTEEEFKEEVIGLAKELRLEPKEIQIRKVNKNRPADHPKGRLAFDPSILDLSGKERAKIILQELIHLR
jgi:hypothetical protein